MNEKLKTLLTLIAFPTLAAALLLASGYAFYYDLEPHNRQYIAAILASRRQLPVSYTHLTLPTSDLV